ncbi:translation initiation factor IF-2 [Aureococcus anophagefferens]|nr:translation initiation factor IF-2 [Aureococcus anophagefferens]
MVFLRRKPAARRKSLQQMLELDEMQARATILDGGSDAEASDDEAPDDEAAESEEEEDAGPILASLREGVAAQLRVSSGTLKLKSEGDRVELLWYLDADAMDPEGLCAASEDASEAWRESLALAGQYASRVRTRLHPLLAAKRDKVEEEQGAPQRRGSQFGRRRASWLAKQSWDLGDEDAKRCYPTGAGLFNATCGSPAAFVVETLDERGDPLDSGGLSFTATLENESHLFKLDVVDENSGTYACEYRVAPPPGLYELSILLNDEFHVEGSPFTCTVAPGPAVAHNSALRGDGVARAAPGDEAHFCLQARDAHGHDLQAGGAAVEVRIDGPAAVVALTDDGDGSYTCCYEVEDATGSGDALGERPDAWVAARGKADARLPAASHPLDSKVLVHVLLDSKHVAGSPFAPEIVPAAAPEQAPPPPKRAASPRDAPSPAGTPRLTHADYTPRKSPASSNRSDASPEPLPPPPAATARTPDKLKLAARPLLSPGDMLKATHRDRAVHDALQASEGQLREVFLHYAHLPDASTSIAVDKYLVFDDDRGKGLVNLGRDFEICPHLLPKSALHKCYSAVANQHGSNPYGLTYAQFLDLVAVLGRAAFDKPHYQALYTTNAAKLSVLLERWGLADPVRLEIIRNRA